MDPSASFNNDLYLVSLVYSPTLPAKTELFYSKLQTSKYIF